MVFYPLKSSCKFNLYVLRLFKVIEVIKVYITYALSFPVMKSDLIKIGQGQSEFEHTRKLIFCIKLKTDQEFNM